MRPTCAICGKPISPPWWICTACEQAYGLTGDYKGWPEWAQQLVRMEQRERRRVEVLTLSDCPVAERMVYGELNDDAWHYYGDDDSENVWHTESD